MKRFAVVLAVLLAFAGATFAAPPPKPPVPTDIFGSLSITKTPDGTTGSFALDIEFPVGPLVALGPIVQYDTVRPSAKDQPQVDLSSMGGTFVLNTNRAHTGFYGSVTAMALTSDFNGWTLTPEVGVKFGGPHTLVRFGVSHPFHYDVGSSPLDLQGWQTRVGIGLRF